MPQFVRNWGKTGPGMLNAGSSLHDPGRAKTFWREGTRFSGRGSPPAVGVLSTGYRLLGSCPRAAGWAQRLCALALLDRPHSSGRPSQPEHCGHRSNFGAQRSVANDATRTRFSRGWQHEKFIASTGWNSCASAVFSNRINSLTVPHFGEVTMNDENKRQHVRRAITRTVHMATGLSPPLKCEMKDVSEFGARLVVSDPRASPQEFLLVLNPGLLRWCRVMWRSDSEIGIQFIRPPQSVTTKKHEETAAVKK